MKAVPKVRIAASLGQRIPGDGTIYVDQSSISPHIGACIYCGSTDDLTDEHTIPYALFGVATLKRATCKSCAVETQKVEQRLLRDTFGQAREYLNFPSRKAKRNGTWRGKRQIVHRTTGVRRDVPLSQGAVALYMAYPNYPPRQLEGEEYDSRHGARSLAYVFLNDPESSIPEEYDDGWIRFNAQDIERCIAKIALCEAIRVADPTIRDKKLSEFIICGATDSSPFIGATLNGEVTDSLHQVTHQRLVRSLNKTEHAWLTNVQIFSFLPMPSYQVIIRPDNSSLVDLPERP